MDDDKMKTALIIGAGIGGLACAKALSNRGYTVTILERHTQSTGASIQNFGMFWPIGMRLVDRPLAFRSREIWLEILENQGCYQRQSGALLLATSQLEMSVLTEFYELGPKHGFHGELLSKEQALAISPIANPDTVVGAYLSRDEVNLDPRVAIPAATSWLENQGVSILWNSSVTQLKNNTVTLEDGKTLTADRIVIAAGQDFNNLHPRLYSELCVQRCKLQMMRTDELDYDMGPMIAGGLSMLHYPAFSVCPSLEKLKEKLTREVPDSFKYGIHAMVSQHAQGELCFGDSHVYDEPSNLLDDEVNAIITRELKKIVRPELVQPTEFWVGRYAKSFSNPSSTFRIDQYCDVFFPNGGIGMTLSFALAEEYFKSA